MESDLDRWEEAIEAYQKAIDLNPEFAWSHYNLAEAAITLDPERDTIERLAKYTGYFNPNLVGVTAGSAEWIELLGVIG